MIANVGAYCIRPLKKFSKTEYIYYLIILLISICISIPMLKGFWTSDDGNLHILRTFGVVDALKDGQIIPIIAPNYGNGFGYAINLFYGPICTYIPLFLKVICFGYINGIKMFFLSTLFLSGISMFKFIKKIKGSNQIAFLASLFYILNPYRITNIYARGAIGEAASFIFIPLVFLGIYCILNKEYNKNYILIIGTVGLILTHSINTFYTAVFAVLYLLFFIKELKDIKVIKYLSIALAIAILITSFYWVNVLEHEMATDYILFNKERMGSTVEDTYSQALSLKDLIFQIDGDNKHIQIGFSVIIVLLITPFILKRIDNEDKKLYTVFYFLGMLSLLMVTKYFPWLILPSQFGMIQFPFRMLGFATFFLSIICAINLKLLFSKMQVWKFLIIILLMFSFILNGLMDIKYNLEIVDEKFNLEEGKALDLRRINREYLPEKASNVLRTYIFDRSQDALILSGEATISSQNKNGTKMKIEINNAKEEVEIELPYLYYLGYNVKLEINDESINIPVHETENGMVGIFISNVEEGIIYVEYGLTTLVKLAYIISFFGIIALVFLWYQSRNHKQQIEQKKLIPF